MTCYTGAGITLGNTALHLLLHWFFGSIVVIYKLGIEPVLGSKSFPIIQNLFPHLSTFVIATLILPIWISIFSGHVHTKSSEAYAAGKEQEVFLPLIMTVKGKENSSRNSIGPKNLWEVLCAPHGVMARL